MQYEQNGAGELYTKHTENGKNRRRDSEINLRMHYKNDLKRAYLILESDEVEKEDYQIIMLQENEIPGILKTDVRYVDNQSHYYYDISGKTSLKAVHEKINLSCEDMKSLVRDLLQAIQTIQKYMLDAKCLLLEPEYIFGDGKTYFFCYYPPGDCDIRTEFHQLTEFFVREVNYRDEDGVYFAYTLHKATMEENYSIEEIMKQFAQEEEKEDFEQQQIVDYTECMESPVLEENMIAEHDDLWEPIRKLLERGRRRRWGYSSDDL